MTYTFQQVLNDAEILREMGLSVSDAEHRLINRGYLRIDAAMAIAERYAVEQEDEE